MSQRFKESVAVLAKHIIHCAAVDGVPPSWADYPAIGQRDWAAVLAAARYRATDPESGAWLLAYDFLGRRSALDEPA